MILPWVCLYPGAMMPLKIFEERYQEMLRLALAGNRMFAIAHSSGEETDCEGIGGIGLVRACVTNDDGSSNLVLQGISRVQFEEVRLDPFPHSRIEVLTDSNDTSAWLESLREQITADFKKLAVEKLEIPEGYLNHIDAIASHGAFTDMVASTVVQSPETRRRLFEELDVSKRMELLHGWLQSGHEE